MTLRARAAIAAAQRRGIAVVLSTARPPRSIRSLHRDPHLRAPVITSNGALIYDLHEDRPILHRPMPRGVALRVLAAVRTIDPPVSVGLELADEWYVNRIDARLQANIDAGRVAVVPIASNLESVIATTAGGVSKVYFTGTIDQRGAARASITQFGLNAEVAFTSSGVGFVEVSAVGVDKGAALRMLAKRLGVSLDGTIIVGNGEDDLAALRVAGLAIAMGQASDLVKGTVHVVTSPNSADDWAEAIERYALAD